MIIKKYKNNKGIATLPTVILISMMTLAVIVSVTSISLNQLYISEGQSQSQSALFYAEGGARDALTRIARNKNYECVSLDCYSIDFVSNGCTNSTDCAKVTISSGSGVTGDPKIITSKGIMKSSTRKIQVSVILDGGTSVDSDRKGEITSTSWIELID